MPVDPAPASASISVHCTVPFFLSLCISSSLIKGIYWHDVDFPPAPLVECDRRARARPKLKGRTRSDLSFELVGDRNDGVELMLVQLGRRGVLALVRTGGLCLSHGKIQREMMEE